MLPPKQLLRACGHALTKTATSRETKLTTFRTNSLVRWAPSVLLSGKGAKSFVSETRRLRAIIRDDNVLEEPSTVHDLAQLRQNRCNILKVTLNPIPSLVH